MRGKPAFGSWKRDVGPGIPAAERFIGNLEPEHLSKVREQAGRLGIEAEIGMRRLTNSFMIPSWAKSVAERAEARCKLKLS